MPRRLFVALAIATVACTTPRPAVVPPAPPASAARARALRDADIALFERRVHEDPESAADFGQLGALYLSRGRATGSWQDFTRAESLAQRSLRLRTVRNAQTFGLLASALLARHAFPEARLAAQRALAFVPASPAALAQLAEIELELGDYASANAHFARVWLGREQFTVAARVARWRELTGRADLARDLLRRAVSAVSSRDDLAPDEIAWFHFRLGDLELRLGHLDAADSAFQSGLRLAPDDHRILGGMARLALARGAWRSAVAFGDRAAAAALDPTTLGVVSEAWRALGDSGQARAYADAMRAAALQQPGPIHRAWGLFLLDHGTPRDARRVLARARAELRTRRDVYGYDLLAWALYRTGDYAAARDAMARALSQGTEDRQLTEHAARIAAATPGS